ncbi:MAG: hypothetical protein R6X32_18415 [Chloroflexota bacterium]
MTKKIALLTLTTIIIFFAMPLIAYAYERITDGGFETGSPSPWDVVVNSSLQVVESSEAPVRTGSYSGAISLTGTHNGGHVGQSIEFVTQPAQGSNFALAGWVYVPSSETNFNTARVRVRYYQTSTCANNPVLFTSPAFDINVRDEWIPFQFITEIPVGVECVTPLLEISRLDTGAPLTVYWDDITFYDSTPTAVSLLSATTTGTTDFIHPSFWLMAGLLAVLSWSFFRRKEAAQT